MVSAEAEGLSEDQKNAPENVCRLQDDEAQKGAFEDRPLPSGGDFAGYDR